MNGLKELENGIFECNKCKRLREVTPCSWPHIYFGKRKDLSLMIVMRNPGLENDANKIGLAEFKNNYLKLWLNCRVGKYLIKNLGKDIVMNKMFFCNICKCSSPNNSILKKDEIENCKSFLEKQIHFIQPKVIISFGAEANTALKSMFLHGIPLFTMLHPSFISRHGDPIISKQQADELNIIIKKYIL